MFGKSILASTALIACVSVALATERGKPSDRIHPRFATGPVRASLPIDKSANRSGAISNESHFAAHAIFNNFSKDKNAEFLSWYGFAAQNSSSSYYYSRNYHYRISTVSYNAFPFAGTGKAPKSMTFPGFSLDPSNYKFQGAILSSFEGLPGQIIVTTSTTTFSDAAHCCAAVRTVKFADAPILADGVQYFVAVKCANTPCKGGWNMEDTDLSGRAVDYLHVSQRETYNFGTSCPTGPSCKTHTFSYTTPWHESTYYPESGAVIIK